MIELNKDKCTDRSLQQNLYWENLCRSDRSVGLIENKDSGAIDLNGNNHDF